MFSVVGNAVRWPHQASKNNHNITKNKQKGKAFLKKYNNIVKPQKSMEILNSLAMSVKHKSNHRAIRSVSLQLYNLSIMAVDTSKGFIITVIKYMECNKIVLLCAVCCIAVLQCSKRSKDLNGRKISQQFLSIYIFSCRLEATVPSHL